MNHRSVNQYKLASQRRSITAGAAGVPSREGIFRGRLQLTQTDDFWEGVGAGGQGNGKRFLCYIIIFILLLVS